jgi:hypothetical protein
LEREKRPPQEKLEVFRQAPKNGKIGMRYMNATNHTKTKLEAEWAREKQITAQFGLTHTILYTLRLEEKIRSISLREEGKKYGARLYNVKSIREYMATMEAKESRNLDQSKTSSSNIN